MSTPVKPVPEGYHSVTPYLILKDAAKAIEFYGQVFGATESCRMPTPDGKVAHAELRIGDSCVMLADENEAVQARSPLTIGDTSVNLLLYIEDVDTVVRRAVAAGATLLMEVKDQFYGDRSGTFVDPFGHKWTVATHIEDLTPEEMERRAKELLTGTASQPPAE
ncbi:MAG: VOC family protein [Verrucomicrobiae bacterium]|nr:VOC family protein [Verrucomicrobiae bacterium]MCP5524525.1 VOC family protein [Verrucomicrobiales bacterium]